MKGAHTAENTRKSIGRSLRNAYRAASLASVLLRKRPGEDGRRPLPPTRSRRCVGEERSGVVIIDGNPHAAAAVGVSGLVDDMLIALAQVTDPHIPMRVLTRCPPALSVRCPHERDILLTWQTNRRLLPGAGGVLHSWFAERVLLPWW